MQSIGRLIFLSNLHSGIPDRSAGITMAFLFGILPKAEVAPLFRSRIEGRRTEEGGRCSASVNLYARIQAPRPPPPVSRPRDNCTRQDDGGCHGVSITTASFRNYIKYATDSCRWVHAYRSGSVLCDISECVDRFQGWKYVCILLFRIVKVLIMIETKEIDDVLLCSTINCWYFSFFFFAGKVELSKFAKERERERAIVFYIVTSLSRSVPTSIHHRREF